MASPIKFIYNLHYTTICSNAMSTSFLKLFMMLKSCKAGSQGVLRDPRFSRNRVRDSEIESKSSRDL